jgi:hypothetical protein
MFEMRPRRFEAKLRNLAFIRSRAGPGRHVRDGQEQSHSLWQFSDVTVVSNQSVLDIPRQNRAAAQQWLLETHFDNEPSHLQFGS